MASIKVFIILIVCVLITIVNGITNGPTQQSLTVEKGKELNGEETRERDVTPEFYRGPNGLASLDRDRDRYGNLLNRPETRFTSDIKGDFITSPGGTRYPPLPTSSYSSNNRDRLGAGYWPTSNPNTNGGRYGYGTGSSTGYSTGSGFSTGTGFGTISSTAGAGSYGYVPGGVYDPNRTPYGPPSTVDYNPYNQYPGYDIQVVQDGYDNYGQYGGNGQYGSGKDLSKKVLLPLAGAALLGIAAALVANPVLFQMGVASHGRRKRSNLDTAQKIAYKGHKDQR